MNLRSNSQFHPSLSLNVTVSRVSIQDLPPVVDPSPRIATISLAGLQPLARPLSPQGGDVQRDSPGRHARPGGLPPYGHGKRSDPGSAALVGESVVANPIAATQARQ
jgi:hypothetical protein